MSLRTSGFFQFLGRTVTCETSEVYTSALNERPFGSKTNKNFRGACCKRKKYTGKTHEPDVTRDKSRGFRPRLGRASREEGLYFCIKTKDTLGLIQGPYSIV